MTDKKKTGGQTKFISDEEQIERLELAEIKMTKANLARYLKAEACIGDFTTEEDIPVGYKKCGKCNKVKKLAWFNKNSKHKLYCTGTCKECQKASAKKSYKNTKKKRNYAKYYQENRERKLEHAKRYYKNNKEEITLRHKKYLATKKGKAVMAKAHAKRQKLLEQNRGIPYTRELVIDRDRGNKEYPICYLCGEPIIDVSGSACHIDHVISIGNGGLDCFSNVTAVHQLCNLKKTKSDEEVDKKFVASLIQKSESYMDNHPDAFELDK